MHQFHFLAAHRQLAWQAQRYLTLKRRCRTESSAHTVPYIKHPAAALCAHQTQATMASMALRSLGPSSSMHALSRAQRVSPHSYGMCSYMHQPAAATGGHVPLHGQQLWTPVRPAYMQQHCARTHTVCAAATYAAATYATASTSTVNGVTETMSYLRNLENGAEIYLVGTAHISKQSAEEVRQLIRRVKPDTVFVELCESRGKALRSKDKKPFDVMQELLGAAFGGPGGLFKALMKGFYKALELVGFESGGEFKAAVEEAQSSGAKVVYGDRDVDETVRRITRNFTFQDLMSLFVSPPQPSNSHGNAQRSSPGSMGSLFGAGGADVIEKMKNRKTVRALVADMTAANPKLAKVLLHERDEFMARELRKQSGRVVAVVGMAHMDGIERWWDRMQTSQQAGHTI